MIGYHFYVYPDYPEAMLPLIARVKQAMKDNGVVTSPLGYRIGWAKPKPFPSRDLAAAYLARPLSSVGRPEFSVFLVLLG